MPACGFSSTHYPTRILMVDENVDQLEISQRFLEGIDSNLKVTSVTTPKGALRLLKKNHYDCVVFDYKMPGINGIILADKIRETSNIPMIIYSGQRSEGITEAAFKAGVNDYMIKEQDPAHFKLLAKRIRTHIEHHRSLLRGYHYQEKIEALHLNVVKLATAKNIEEIATITYNTMQSALGFEIGGIKIVEGETITNLKSTASPGKTLVFPLNGKGIGVRAARTGETQLVGDVRKDEDYISIGKRESMRSELDVPVKIDSRVVAVLTMISSAVNAFSDEDVQLVETLAMNVSSTMLQLRQTEALLALRTRELISAERKTAAGRGKSTLGHDLRGPLAIISNAASLAVESPEKAEKMLTIIKSYAERNLAMIDELMERIKDIPLLLKYN